MIRYRCYGNHAPGSGVDVDKLPVRERHYIDIASSVCEICGNREHVETSSQLYWCDTCQIPLYESTCSLCHSSARRFARDCRIVYPEEKLLLEILLEREIGSLDRVSVWNGSGNKYYGNGVKLPLKIQELHTYDVGRIRELYQAHREKLHTEYFTEMLSRFVRANQKRFHELEQEALQYIQDSIADYDISEMFVSFSGGKDSSVVADLVRRATANAGILHIFGDTTLEFPETYRYVEEYKRAYPGTYVISSKNTDKDFTRLCGILGPPSRVMRWCCTIFKTGALNRKIESTFRRKSRVLSFQGIRRSESVLRSKYDRTSRSSKIGQQVVAAPIIDWYDFDVWLYIATTGIPFNRAYRLGYARVGCWCCPNNSTWSEFLSRIHMPEEYESFRRVLLDFARQVGKPDPEEYVDAGNWKARQGGNGLALARRSVVRYTPCVKENDAFQYELARPLEQEFYELFKPFGTVNTDMGNRRLGEVYIINEAAIPVLRIQGRLSDTGVRVIVDHAALPGAEGIEQAKKYIDCQITKYQMCIGCRACESVCRFGAIKVSGREGATVYRIDEKRCMQCRECIEHFTMGCYMRKVLTIKRE